ncbi:DUF362 domain-containing protein [Fusibacter bizertensis]|uniref:DUF362 domain-containing protein n=1 Tax=Fusibacter bizertensis TaxID=1488331 RepID=A0ABT6NCL5_9FIRM|nr:DUF362 domain-containing protein [Fusibacter bizertensis]MDH8678170.1 DUF362 domain-containing protein [Fusibacter bizertensis]
MSKVYFKRVDNKDIKALSDAALSLMETLIAQEGHTFKGTVPMKVHFGEKGNDTYVPSTCYEGVIDYLKANEIPSAFIETNVLYRGARTTAESHKQIAKDHGFTQLPVIIADGEMGELFDEIEINKEFFKSCKIGKAFGDYEQFIVMSHFKGHGSAGFGGAMKQLSMGFASRGGKMAQHAGINPVVKASKCIACGLCIKKCDVDAITMEEKAFINHDKCVGCAGCIAVCPVGAIQSDWTGKNFKEKIAEYAYAAQLGKDNIYITYLINVTPECDCMGQHMHTVAEDIGVFVSKDPVAIDAACIDMLQKEAGEKLFDDGRDSIRHAVKIGLGTDAYELIG